MIKKYTEQDFINAAESAGIKIGLAERKLEAYLDSRGETANPTLFAEWLKHFDKPNN